MTEAIRRAYGRAAGPDGGSWWRFDTELIARPGDRAMAARSAKFDRLLAEGGISGTWTRPASEPAVL